MSKKPPARDARRDTGAIIVTVIAVVAVLALGAALLVAYLLSVRTA
jgi:hypothetical protein